MRYEDLNPNQKRTLRAIRREGKRAGANRVQVEAAVQTVLVEANAEHVDHGDRDSVGAFQQRPSQGWGPAGETVSRDARQFFQAAKKAYRPGMSAGDLAATVQRPAAQYRGRYAQRAGDAQSLLGGTPTDGPGIAELAAQRPSAPQPELGPDAMAQRLQAVQMLQRGQSSPLQFAMQIQDAEQLAPEPAEGGREPLTPTKSRQAGDFKITGPNPGRLNKPIVAFMGKVAGVYGKPISGADGTGHSVNTVNGRRSQHTDGNATDVPARGKQLILLGQAALIAAGMPEKQARKQQGGLFNVNGHQIIFNTHEGGDHTDHLHASAV